MNERSEAATAKETVWRLAVLGLALRFLPSGSVVAAVTYDFTRTFGTIDVSGTLSFPGSAPGPITIADLNANATWTLTFSSRGFPIDPFTLNEGNSTWSLEPAFSFVEITATDIELVSDLVTPPFSTVAVVLESDVDLSQFRFVQDNQLVSQRNQVLIRDGDSPTSDSFDLPYDEP